MDGRNGRRKRRRGVDMKKIGCVLSVCILGLILLNPLSSVAIERIIGIQGQCDKASLGCTSPLPLTVTVTCDASSAFCPDTFHPSWTDSNRLWGFRNNGSGTAPTCVTSTNLGTTWAGCTTQPWTGTLFPQIASASDGSLVTLADDPSSGPADCTIKRSIDNGATWGVVFTSSLVTCNHSGLSQTMYCQPTGGQCDAGNTRFDANTRVFRSVDNGANWTTIDVSTTGTVSLLGGIVFNGTQGVFSSDFVGNTGVAFSTGNAWVNSGVWALSASYNTIKMGFLFGGTSPQLFTQSVGTPGIFHRVDTSGTSLQQITPPTIRVAVASRLEALYWDSTRYYMTYPPTTGGGIGIVIAVSTDNFASFNVLLTNTTFATDRNTIYKHNGKLLISTVGAGFIKVS